MSKCCTTNVINLPASGGTGDKGASGNQGIAGLQGPQGADGATGGQEVYQAEKVVVNITVPLQQAGALVSSSNPYSAEVLTQTQLGETPSGLLKNIFYQNGAGMTPAQPTDLKYSVWYTFQGVSTTPCVDASLLGYVSRVYFDSQTASLTMSFDQPGNYRICFIV